MMKTIKAVAAFAALLTASVTRAESVDAKSYVPTYDAVKAWYLGELGVTNLLNAGITGRGVKVGVVDTGIGDIVTGTHTNLKCAAVHGVPSGAPHGTGVEGIIASDTFGIAPECSLYAYEGTGFVDDINGLWWCLTNGCKVVNFSGGYTPFDYTESQLEWARQQIRTMIDDYGLILVAAGGNAPNETLSFPQDMEGVINIGGVTRALESAGLNDNWAKDFCALGQNVPAFPRERVRQERLLVLRQHVDVQSHWARPSPDCARDNGDRQVPRLRVPQRGARGHRAAPRRRGGEGTGERARRRRPPRAAWGRAARD